MSGWTKVTGLRSPTVAELDTAGGPEATEAPAGRRWFKLGLPVNVGGGVCAEVRRRRMMHHTLLTLVAYPAVVSLQRLRSTERGSCESTAPDGYGRGPRLTPPVRTQILSGVDSRCRLTSRAPCRAVATCGSVVA